MAVVLVMVLGGYHAVLHATYGVTPCKGLLTTGMYKVSTRVQGIDIWGLVMSELMIIVYYRAVSGSRGDA